MNEGADRASPYITGRKGVHVLMIPLLIGLAFAVYALVYATGGIKYVYSHSMYFPIILGGYLYGARGGILVGLLGSILLGPFMPIDTVTHEPQETINWLYRGLFFVSIGALVGYGATQLRNRMRRIRHLAHHDRDTGLPNRTSTIEYLSQLLMTASARPYVLMKMACDNLMEIEVALGFEASDSIIRQMQRRLTRLMPEGTYLSKTHRSEFAAVLADTDLAEAERLAAELADAIKQPFTYQDIPLHVVSVIGYVPFYAGGEERTDADRLLQSAELALMRARSHHQPASAYDPADHRLGQENLALLGELRQALVAKQLRLYYQPKVSLSDHRMVGAEALMRWHHPERGIIPPDRFIPQAEQSGLISELTGWALHSALQQWKQWQGQQDNDDLKIAVNVSVHDLHGPAFPDIVLQALEQHDLESTQLELEVTENVLMENIDTSLSALNRLSEAKIIIAIDDFGTGYSSLKYLDLLPTTAIKIDKSFVFKLLSDRGCRHIIEAAIGLAHSLDMKVIAEGVENLETFRLLRELGCDVAQGYFISHPLQVAHFPEFSFHPPAAEPAA